MWLDILSIKYPEYEELIVDNNIIIPGSKETILLNAGKLPSGTKINVVAHIIRAEKPGPTVLLLGGIHGDEINGIEIVRKSLINEMFDHLVCGTVICIPLLNVYGFNSFSREMSDGKDVNRSFPGHISGSLASRTARIITKKIFPHIDLALDFHTGGASRYNYPQIRYYKKDILAAKLAQWSGVPFLLEQALIPNSFRKVAHDADIPALVYEGGETLRFDKLSISNGINCIKSVFTHLKMANFEGLPDKITMNISKSKWIRASAPGIFYWYKHSGDFVKNGEILGTIHEPSDRDRVEVISQEEGYIIGHNNACVVSLGDALFHIGVEYNEVRSV